MKHLYVLVSWPENMDKILKFCFCFLFCELKLFHDSSYRQKVAGDINSLNLHVFFKITYDLDTCIELLKFWGEDFLMLL